MTGTNTSRQAINVHIHALHGQLARVVAIETVGRSIILPTDRPLHLDYAYTTTAHSVQGLAHDIGGPNNVTAEMTIDAHEAALELGNP